MIFRVLIKKTNFYNITEQVCYYDAKSIFIALIFIFISLFLILKIIYLKFR